MAVRKVKASRARKSRFGFRNDYAAKDGEVMTPNETISEIHALEQQVAQLKKENKTLRADLEAARLATK